MPSTPVPVEMTEQEIFDAVCAHLARQQRPAVDVVGADRMCVYHASDGCKCAVGCLIPDALYVPEIEGLSLSDAAVIGEPELGQLLPFIVDHGGLLNDLQVAHDTAENAVSLRRMLKVTAKARGLKADAADTVQAWTV